MSSPRPQLTIASIGVSPTPINVTIFSEDSPVYRENGGDLRQGDRWIDTEHKIESVYYNDEWITVTTIPLPTPPPIEYEGDNKDITVEVRDADDGGGGNLIWKPEDDLLIFEEADMDSRIPTDITSLPLLTNP